MYLPRISNNEFVGVISEMLGGGKVKVEKKDGQCLVCRIPGRLRIKKIKLRIGDAVVVKPWDIDPENGDIVFMYHSELISVLKAKGYL